MHMSLIAHKLARYIPEQVTVTDHELIRGLAAAEVIHTWGTRRNPEYDIATGHVHIIGLLRCGYLTQDGDGYKLDIKHGDDLEKHWEDQAKFCTRPATPRCRSTA